MARRSAPPPAPITGSTSGSTLSRRRLLQGGAAAAGAAALTGGLTPEWGRVLERATAASCSSAQLSDVGHIVMFMQENRSFDQYFGLFPGVRGFGDPTGTFEQRTTSSQVPPGYVLPMHTPMSQGGGCLTDVSHDWEPQHDAWNGGAMDGWVDAHALTEPNNPWSTMSYYDDTDLPLHWALAEAFTLCDGYHCSVIGPTDPNHLYWLSAWLDPAGTNGGPLTKTTSSACGAPGRPRSGP